MPDVKMSFISAAVIGRLNISVSSRSPNEKIAGANGLKPKFNGKVVAGTVPAGTVTVVAFNWTVPPPELDAMRLVVVFHHAKPTVHPAGAVPQVRIKIQCNAQLNPHRKCYIVGARA